MTDDLDVHLPAIAAGDPGAFAGWLSRAEDPLRRSLSSWATRVDAEAVLQEALLRVWQVAPRVAPDGRPNALLRLAVRVARNAAIDELRRSRSTPVDADALERAANAVEDPIEPAVPDPALRRAIERCRAALKGPPARAFEARIASHGGAPDRDLARDLDMQVNTFLKNFGRARALLVECLRRAGVTLEAP